MVSGRFGLLPARPPPRSAPYPFGPLIYNASPGLSVTESASSERYPFAPYRAPCRIRSDRQTTSLTLTTGVCEAGTKMRGASNMNIHYDVTGLLTAAWRSHSGRIVWAA